MTPTSSQIVKKTFQPSAKELKKISTLSQYVYAKLIFSWDKLSWHEAL